MSLDDLAQQFADLKTLEFNAFLHKINLCAEARWRGSAVVNALCGYPGYTPQSVKRLGQLENLPDYIKDPQLPLGIYWQALRMSSDGDDVDLDKFAELIEDAICNQRSLREFKDAHGIVAPDRRQPVFDGMAELVEAGEYKFTNREVKVY